jgi:DNA polymerase-3 subunit delta'
MIEQYDLLAEFGSEPMPVSPLSPPIIGHAWVLRLLDSSVAEGRIRHAYLFHGPARVGKSTVARWLAMRLICEKPDAPCGQCESCRRIRDSRHLDVRSLQAAGDHDDPLGVPMEIEERATRSAERAISIGQIRALQHDAALASNEAAWKIYVVIGADALTLPAANALLKTLEEPPSRVLVILTSSDSYELLPTIVSRCQTLRFGLVSTSEIALALETSFSCPSDQAQLLARLSGGRPGWAIDASESEVMLSDRLRVLDEFEPTLVGGFRERLGLAEKLAASYSRDPNAVLRSLVTWRVWWWDIFLMQQGCHDLVTNVDRLDALDRVARATSSESVARFLRGVGETTQQLAQNVNPRLALENLLINVPAVR